MTIITMSKTEAERFDYAERDASGNVIDWRGLTIPAGKTSADVIKTLSKSEREARTRTPGQLGNPLTADEFAEAIESGERGPVWVRHDAFLRDSDYLPRFPDPLRVEHYADLYDTRENPITLAVGQHAAPLTVGVVPSDEKLKTPRLIFGGHRFETILTKWAAIPGNHWQWAGIPVIVAVFDVATDMLEAAVRDNIGQGKDYDDKEGPRALALLMRAFPKKFGTPGDVKAYFGGMPDQTARDRLTAAMTYFKYATTSDREAAMLTVNKSDLAEIGKAVWRQEHPTDVTGNTGTRVPSVKEVNSLIDMAIQRADPTTAKENRPSLSDIKAARQDFMGAPDRNVSELSEAKTLIRKLRAIVGNTSNDDLKDLAASDASDYTQDAATEAIAWIMRAANLDASDLAGFSALDEFGFDTLGNDDDENAEVSDLAILENAG